MLKNCFSILFKKLTLFKKKKDFQFFLKDFLELRHYEGEEEGHSHCYALSCWSGL